MKTNLLIIGSVFLGSVFINSASAGTCEIKYTRAACPGQESISFKKCKGKASCSKIKKISEVEKCKSLAVKACKNNRTSITKSKVINATFDGKELISTSGSTDFCTDYAKAQEQFNQCEDH